MKNLYQKITEAIEYPFYYYSGLFGLAVEKAEIKTEYRNHGKHGMTYFIATVPKTKISGYTPEEIRQIMQEYLETCILPHSQIPPYSVGNEIMESLYIDKIYENPKGYKIEILFIDNATAFRYVKNSKQYERRDLE